MSSRLVRTSLVVLALVAAMLVVKPFVAFLRRHDFVPFAWYRIAAGVVLFALLALQYLA